MNRLSTVIPISASTRSQPSGLVSLGRRGFVQEQNMLKYLPHTSGIYQIKCTSNGKFYIGSAVDVLNRCEHHRSSLRRGDHRNAHLQAAWIKYGEDHFEFTVLELTDRDDL